MLFSEGVTQQVFTKNMRYFMEKILPYCCIDYNMQSEYRWTNVEKEEFVMSTCTGMNISLFVVAKIDSCISYCEMIDDIDSKRYLEKLKRDKTRIVDGEEVVPQYLIVDSCNRTNTIEEFTRGLVRIITDPNDGKHRFKIGTCRFDVERDVNDRYTGESSSDFRQEWGSTPVNISFITEATRKQLHKVFGNLNKGVSLNPAEKRNNELSTVSFANRDLAGRYKEDLIHATGLKSHRRYRDDFIAKIMFNHRFGMDRQWDKNSLMEMYHEDNPYRIDSKKFSKDFVKFMRILKTDNNVKLITKKNNFLDLWNILQKMKNGNHFLPKENYGGFVKEFVDMNNLLHQETTEYPLNDGGSRTYKGLLSNNTTIRGNIRLEILNNRWDYKKFFIKRELRNGKCNTVKCILAVRQGMITPEGETIDRDILYTDAYHIGHIIPIAVGGTDNLDNMCVQTKEANLRLGTGTVDMSRFSDKDWYKTEWEDALAA